MAEVRFYADSVKGRRSRNEDDALAEKVGERYIFAVADGLGGHAAGDVASRMAISAVREEMACHHEDPGDLIRAAFAEANRRIRRYNREHHSNAATTLVVAVVQEGGEIWIGNVGDSRAYLFSKGRTWHTRDHTRVQQLLDQGRITPEEAFGHPMGHLLEKALGLQREIKPDISHYRCGSSVLLLSTDGLHDTLRDERLSRIAISLPPEEAVARLIKEALEEGSSDNITAIVAAISGH
ncbi:MAG: protein phosphatase 2C domain-containing protein [Methanomicrobiaceae archaeon]|nr:protein phosphatase 2C domain-containing protein [Methanomicrobiaceae archaeon]